MKTRVFAFVMIAFFFFVDAIPIYATSDTHQIQQCFDRTNCARLEIDSNQSEDLFRRAFNFIENTPRTKIIDKEDLYVKAEVTSKVMRFVDDLEIKALPENSKLQIRSSSRIGLVDFGTNKKRVDKILAFLDS